MPRVIHVDHRRLQKMAGKGKTIYTIARYNRDGSPIAARFFVIYDRELREITGPVSGVLNKPLDARAEDMRTNYASEAVTRLGIELWNDPHAFNHKLI